MINIEELLNLPDIRIIKIDEIPSSSRIDIYVETTESGTKCHVCKNVINKKHGKDKERKIRHLPAFGVDVNIIYQPNRYVCESCKDNPTTTATPSWHSVNSSYTTAYEQHILLQIINSTVADVAMKERITPDSVTGILDRLVTTEIDWSTINYIGTLGIDEFAIKKGYKDYISVISCRANGKKIILATLKGRKKAIIKGFLKSIPKRLKKTVDTVCVDMYDGYINAVKEVFKSSTILVIDRFHVAKLYRGSLDSYRQKTINELQRDLSTSEYNKVVGATKILRKSKEYLTDQEKEIVNELFSYAPKLMEAYSLTLKLTHIFNTHYSKEEALVKFQEWIYLVRKSKLTFLNKFIKTFNKLKNEITNYFINRESSGFVEGLNNKIKVLKRRCYGIFDLKRLYQRLYLDVSGYDILLPKS